MSINLLGIFHENKVFMKKKTDLTKTFTNKK